MPIKPENKHRYPSDWPQIRERILKRAGFRCEHGDCKARHYSVGQWLLADSGLLVWGPVWGQDDNPKTYADARAVAAEHDMERESLGFKRLTVIVLTIAHLDHQPENCADENLLAMCQRHHLAYDRAHHLESAQRTRRLASCTGELFG